MAANVLVGGNLGRLSAATSASFYGVGMWASAGNVISTEAQVQLLAKASGTFSNLNIYVSAYTHGSAATFKSRKNTADGTMTISLNATGAFSDATHSDSVNGSTDKYCVESTGGTSGNHTVQCFSMQFVPTSGFASFYTLLGQFGLLSASTTYYFDPLGQTGNGDTTEANAKVTLEAPGTITNFYVFMSSYASTNPQTCNSRVGAASDGNLTLSINTTGAFEDTTHSDTIAAGDIYRWRMTTGAGTVNSGTNFSGFLFTGSASSYDVSCGYNKTGAAFNQLGVGASQLCPLIGTPLVTTVEANAQLTYSFTDSITFFRGNLTSASGQTTAPTATMRKGGAPGNGTVTWAKNTTGSQIDSTHTDSVVAGNLICGGFNDTGAGTTNIGSLGFTSGTAPNVNVNVTGTSGAGAAHVATPSVAVTASKASASGAPHAVTPSSGPTAAKASAAGAARAAVPEVDKPLSSASAAAAATAVGFAYTGAVGVSGRAATPAAAPVSLVIDSNVHIAGAHATGASGALAKTLDKNLTPVVSAGSPGSVAGFPSPADVFPVYRLMGDTPVAAFGDMTDEAVAVIGRLRAAGPDPVSFEIEIEGVAARAVARGVSPFRNVNVRPAGASSAGAAGTVIAA